MLDKSKLIRCFVSCICLTLLPFQVGGASALLAQLVEHFTRNEGVTSSNLAESIQIAVVL